MQEERIQTEKEAISAIAATDEWKLVDIELPDGNTVRLKLFKLGWFDLKRLLRKVADAWDKVISSARQLGTAGTAKVETHLGNLIAEIPILADEFISRAYGLKPEEFQNWPADINLHLLAEAVEYNVTGNKLVLDFFSTLLKLKIAPGGDTGQTTNSSQTSSDGAST
jgi:hypothetical protein